MLRRTFLSSALAAPALLGAGRIDLSRLSLLTDEVANGEAEAIAFARQYGVRWIELRETRRNGQSYITMEPAAQREAARSFKDAGLAVSYLDAPLLKFQLPGTKLARPRQESPEQQKAREERNQRAFDNRLADLRQAISTAHVFGVEKVRIFAFSRVAEPEALLPRIAELLDEMAAIAESEGIRLLIENEASCNVATTAELARICQLVPRRNFGINWDPLNAAPFKENSFPEAYALLPKSRIGNVHLKARGWLSAPTSSTGQASSARSQSTAIPASSAWRPTSSTPPWLKRPTCV